MTIPFHTPLSRDQQHMLGIAPPQPLAMADQVRFSQIDVLNHVNNVVYIEWFERLRIRYHQEWGMSDYSHTEVSPRIVIRSGEIRYLEEMKLDEVYVATCGCIRFRNTSYTMHQEVWAAGRLRATFDCVLVLLRQDGTGRFPIPDAVRARFLNVDGAIAE